MDISRNSLINYVNRTAQHLNSVGQRVESSFEEKLILDRTLQLETFQEQLSKTAGESPQEIQQASLARESQRSRQLGLPLALAGAATGVAMGLTLGAPVLAGAALLAGGAWLGKKLSQELTSEETFRSQLQNLSQDLADGVDHAGAGLRAKPPGLGTVATNDEWLIRTLHKY
jgi:hypothetical protein